MVRRQDVDFYRWFSRKELQSLCKKYSLPANRSTSEYMAESLASYILRGFGIQASSGAHSRVPASRKRDSFGNELNIARGGCFQGTVVREPGFILGDSTQTQKRNGGLIDSECAPSYMRRLNEKGPLDPQLENTMKRVDNWINSLRNEFNVYERKSTHSSELGIDNATKCKKQKSLEQDKDGNVRRESSINQAMKDNTQVPPDDPSNGERSLATIPDSSGPGQIAPSWLNRIAKADVLTWTVFGRN
ncbi:hypothetical protein DY000_02061772 [Brassica cretica]|uniref:Uncharacterized protein n=1 Tax=Brassica cretica TaxID=69181 RepID=A0ABQ7B164_BRACR|nr:hypothetical protein DY000_02061772 [Brassica cretica]